MIKLAGDIGGTNARLMLAEENDDGINILLEKSYLSNDYACFEDVLERFLADQETSPVLDSACFAVAGPVKAGVSKVTNLPWVISETALQSTLNIQRVKLINDFIAVAHGIERLADDDVLLVQQGMPDTSSHPPSAAIIGAGTGLGVAHRVWLAGKYHVLPSESGHVNFAPANAEQRQLLAWLQQEHNHVSLESIL
jgi:glucokinase